MLGARCDQAEALVALKDKIVPLNETFHAHVVEAIEAGLTAGRLPCPAAFAIARELAVTPQAVGYAADLMRVHISRCQLGLFGYAAKQGYTEAGIADLDVPESLSEAIQEAQDNAGNVSCADLWKLATTYSAPRMLVGYVTDRLGIHVTHCRLGAF